MPLIDKNRENHLTEDKAEGDFFVSSRAISDDLFHQTHRLSQNVFSVQIANRQKHY